MASSTRHGLGYIPDIHDIRDFKFSVQRPQQLPMLVDLRNGPVQLPGIYDQLRANSCTANALAFALEYERRKQALPSLANRPSRLFIYYNERSLENSQHSDSGAMLRDGIKSLSTWGACSEQCWPYDVGQVITQPKPDCYTEATHDKIITYQRIMPGDINSMRLSLANNLPFVFGVPLYSSFEGQQAEQTGVVPMPHPGEAMLGGHAMIVVGYNDSKQQFITANSWGTGWGDKGYIYMPYTYIAQMAQDLWNIQLVAAN